MSKLMTATLPEGTMPLADAATKDGPPAEMPATAQAPTPKRSIVKCTTEELMKRASDDVAIRPIVLGSSAVAAFAMPGPTLGPEDLALALERVCTKVRGGDLSYIEDTLTAQVVILNMIFTHQANQAAKHTDLAQRDAAFRNAFRAQAQVRQTAETLALIKHPPSAQFVRQQNVSVAGAQQVNNGSPARARKLED